MERRVFRMDLHLRFSERRTVGVQDTSSPVRVEMQDRAAIQNRVRRFVNEAHRCVTGDPPRGMKIRGHRLSAIRWTIFRFLRQIDHFDAVFVYLFDRKMRRRIVEGPRECVDDVDARGQRVERHGIADPGSGRVRRKRFRSLVSADRREFSIFVQEISPNGVIFTREFHDGSPQPNGSGEAGTAGTFLNAPADGNAHDSVIRGYGN